MSKRVACPECNGEYEALGTHWRYNSDHRPSFTDHQLEIITGLLMGDACINTCGKNSRIKCKMVSSNYLEYIDNEFSCLGTGVVLKQTAKESAKESRDRSFNKNVKVQNYSDVYVWCSRVHPELEEFLKWYSTGEKVWPSDIELTPTVLKHWYCGDGTWANSKNSNHIQISMANEVENTEKVSQLFENVGLSSPINYSISERDDGRKDCIAQFSVEQSKELWEYMGDPLPDFEYKWPERYR